MNNYRFTISYDGSRYSGWEHQKHTDDTIQGKIEAVLAKMCDTDTVKLVGAGRTDAGVHAKAMTANALLDTTLPVREIRDYMNRYLPDDIVILEVSEASQRFHSRYNATGKTYCYTCYVGQTKPVFDRRYVTRLEGMPDIAAMNQAAAYLTGMHDFASFCGSGAQVKTTIRTVTSMDVWRDGDMVTIRISGTGFLYNMVRIISGTLIEIGNGQYPPERMDKILKACDRAAAGPTAPAQGLTLMGIEFF